MGKELRIKYPNAKIGDQITLDITYIEDGVTKTKTIIPDNLIQNVDEFGDITYKVIDAKTSIKNDLVNKIDLTNTCTANQKAIYPILDGDATAGKITKVEMRGGQAQQAFGELFQGGVTKVEVQLEANVEFWVNTNNTDFSKYLIRNRKK